MGTLLSLGGMLSNERSEVKTYNYPTCSIQRFLQPAARIELKMPCVNDRVEWIHERFKKHYDSVILRYINTQMVGGFRGQSRVLIYGYWFNRSEKWESILLLSDREKIQRNGKKRFLVTWITHKIDRFSQCHCRN